MTRSSRRNCSPEFKFEAAQLVLDQHYTVTAATATSPMTPEQIEIRELKKKQQCAFNQGVTYTYKTTRCH